MRKKLIINLLVDDLRILKANSGFLMHFRASLMMVARETFAPTPIEKYSQVEKFSRRNRTHS
jgi:hypothetical protein